MWLYFSGDTMPNGRFFWKCTILESCSQTIEYESIQPHLDFVEGDINTLMMDFQAKNFMEQETVITEIKSQMVSILKHFIGCTWGAHYMTQYYKMIHPYLDNPFVLDFVLRSDVIIDRKNTVVGNSGAKIYSDLARMMSNVSSPKIKAYLIKEFGTDFC